MSIYIFNTNFIGEKLVPPALRGTIHLAWLKVILAPIQSLWRLIFVDYKDGSLYARYNSLSAYVRTDRVVYSDRKVYECILNASAGITPANTTYWVKVNDNFIGASERVKYNSQKILFEYALNKWFFVDPAADQIYIENNIVNGSFFLLGGQDGLTSSKLANNSVDSSSYLGNAYTPTLYDYTIYVPLAVFNAQGSTTANREQAIRNFADKYNLAGMIYNVVTY